LVIENIINIETENYTALWPGSLHSLLHPRPVKVTIRISFISTKLLEGGKFWIYYELDKI